MEVKDSKFTEKRDNHIHKELSMKYGSKVALIGKSVIISYFKRRTKESVDDMIENENYKINRKSKYMCNSILNLDNVAALREALNKLASDIKNFNESEEVKEDILVNHISRWEGYNKIKEWGFSYNRKKAMDISKDFNKDGRWYRKEIYERGSEMIPRKDDIDSVFRMIIDNLNIQIFDKSPGDFCLTCGKLGSVVAEVLISGEQ